jgi:hypothetical protein
MVTSYPVRDRRVGRVAAKIERGYSTIAAGETRGGLGPRLDPRLDVIGVVVVGGRFVL